mmetsp:Transcript_12537/g.21214  ORF Transcript_12537/g.21214 Transcript_12537/m.21214 type:complete len:88 (-) Transcript_12537:8-271(-)
MERWSCWHFNRCTLPPTSTKMGLLALHPLHTTSYIDKDGKMVLLALQPLHTTSYIDKGEASIIATREVVSLDGLLSYKSSPCCSSFV